MGILKDVYITRHSYTTDARNEARLSICLLWRMEFRGGHVEMIFKKYLHSLLVIDVIFRIIVNLNCTDVQTFVPIPFQVCCIHITVSAHVYLTINEYGA
jgi:hypothetical protein